MLRTAGRSFAIALALAASAGGARAQTAPNWSYGYVPTRAQWNAIFASKQDYLGAPPLLTTGGTMTGPLITAASRTASAGFNLPQGAAPTSPNNGDAWMTSAGLFYRANGTTFGPLVGSGSGSFAATAPLGVTFPSNVITYALAYDANFTNNGSNQLALARIAAGHLIANGTNASAEPTDTTWNAFASQAIGNSNGLLPYRTGGSWGTISTGVSGPTIPLNNTPNVFSQIQTINLNAASLPAALTGTALQIGQADGVIARAELDSFGASAPGVYSCLYGRGTGAAPTAVQSGDELCSLNSWGYVGAATKSGTAVAAFRTFAAENYSSGHQGSYARIATTAIAGTTLTDRIGFENDGGITVPPSVTGGDPGAGKINASGLQVSGVNVLTANQTITLSGDVSGSGATAITTTVAKVNGVTYGASPSINTVPVVTGANTVTYEPVPNAALANSSVTLNAGTNFGMTTPGATSLGATGVFGATTDNLRFANLGLGVAAPTGGGQIAQTLGANNLTATAVKRFTDTTPTGNFIDLQNAAGASLQTIDITGSFALDVNVVSGKGFTIAGAATSGNVLRGNGTRFVSSAIQAGDLPLGSSSAFGAVKVDNVTITASAGIISAVGGAATSVTVGTTTVGSGTTGYLLYNNAGTLGNETIASILTQGNGITISGTTNATIAANFASKSDQQSASSGVLSVSPLHQQDHPSASKAWALIQGGAGGGTVLAGYNVSSSTRNSAGDYTVTFTTGFASANYACVANPQSSGGASGLMSVMKATTRATGSVGFQFFVPSTLASADPSEAFSVECNGAQ